MCKRYIEGLPLTCLQLETWPTTQACALSGNGTGNLSVLRPALNPLSHTSQNWYLLLIYMRNSTLILYPILPKRSDSGKFLAHLYTSCGLHLQRAKGEPLIDQLLIQRPYLSLPGALQSMFLCPCQASADGMGRHGEEGSMTLGITLFKQISETCLVQVLSQLPTLPLAWR